MNNDQAKPQLIVWWTLWFALLSGVVIQYAILSKNSVTAEPLSLNSPLLLACLAPFTLSMIIRWVLLPRAKNATTALPIYLVGMVMAEATCLLGIFLAPGHQQPLFIASVVGIFQYIPVFAQRLIQAGNQSPRI